MPTVYSVEQLSHFLIRLFERMGCPQQDAHISTKILLAAELRGIPSHGVLRIPDYVKLWQKGRINATPNIHIEHETPSTAVVNGDSGLGMVVAYKAMTIAIEKAKQVGTGWVVVNNSNHYSIAGYYAMMALQEDMIGIAMTNANPLVAPTYSTDRLLGTNPIAVAIPAGKQLPFVADFATTPIARGKLNVMHRKGEKAPLGFVQDKHGQPSTDPNILTQGGAILPLGGDKEHGSHKGFCLGAIVDIFSSILPGAHFGPFVPPSVDYLSPIEGGSGIGTGHFFGAMRIDAFQKKEQFKNRMDEWITTFKQASPIKGQPHIIIPGEPEVLLEKRLLKEGIPILESVNKELIDISNQLSIAFI